MTNKNVASTPDFINVYGKRYSGQNVLEGFETLTRVRSRNTRLDKHDEWYNSLKDVNDALRIIYRCEDSSIDPISKNVFKNLLKGLTTKKAEDINNVAVEHVMYASEDV